MEWILLGKIVYRLIGTAVNLTESTNTSFKGADKLKLAMGMVGNLATDCQALDPQQLAVMQNPQVQVAMQNVAKAQVDLENTVARVAASLGIHPPAKKS